MLDASRTPVDIEIMRVTVVVLGDIGLSPRMQNHAESLAFNDIDVDIVACKGNEMHANLRKNSRVTCHLIATTWLSRRLNFFYLPSAALRALVQAFQLAFLLLVRISKPNIILVQTPPAVPTLLITLMAARWRKAKLIIDWHNLAWTVLGQTLGSTHPAVRFTQWSERTLGAYADEHLCVSQAMQRMLCGSWQFKNVHVVYDRPTRRFHSLPSTERKETKAALTMRLGIPTDTIVLICPSSWTRDDDMQLLIDAIEILKSPVAPQEWPPLAVLLTGRGSLRARWEPILSNLSDDHVYVRFAWLETDEYPTILAAADLGLSLHRSTSGLDLPMKIVDMIGAGIPFLMLDYGPCVTELADDGRTALLFKDTVGLADHLLTLREHGIDGNASLKWLRFNVLASHEPAWDVYWQQMVLPIIAGDESNLRSVQLLSP